MLNELHGRLQTREIRYWRDKRGHEVDFVLLRRGRRPVAVECTWRFDGECPGLAAFARRYPAAELVAVAHDATGAHRQRCDGVEVWLTDLDGLFRLLEGPPDPRGTPP